MSGGLFGPRDVGVPSPSGTVLVDRPTGAIPPVVGELGDGPDARVEDATAPDTVEGLEGEDAVEAVDAPEVDVGPDAVEVDDGPDAVEVGDGDDGEAGGPWVELPDDLVARVRAPASERAQDDARRLNRAGLVKHRRLELDAAIRDYLRALDVWPGHPFSNYNLACAYALTARPEDALRHLAILAAIGGETPRERLLSARLDPDFDALLDDPRFRGLTGYAPVWVSWAPSWTRRGDADRLTKALRASRIPARVSASAWPDEVEGPTLFIRADDPIAEAMAREVRAAVTVSDLAPDDSASATRRRLVEVVRGDLEATRALVIVLPGRSSDPPPEGGADAPVDEPSPPAVGDTSPGGEPPVERAVDSDDAVVGVRGEPRAFADLIGVRLVASEGGVVSALEFRPTGFFSWEIADGTGARTQRRGRYALRGDSLALTYREDREVPGADPSAPEVSFEENKQTVHPLVVHPDGLTLDQTRFLVR